MALSEDMLFFFPGQGAQFVGMAQTLLAESARARDLFRRGSELLGLDLAEKCLRGPEEDLNSTRLSQPAIFLHSTALLDHIGGKAGGGKPFGTGIAARGTAGLSLGEYSALVFAGCLEFEDALRIVVERGRLMQEACDETRGGMTALLGLAADKVEESVRAVRASSPGAGVISVANYNSPDQTVISGEPAALEAAVQHARTLGLKRAMPLRVAGAYHSPLMASAARKLKPLLDGVAVRPPRCPFYSNVSGKRVDDPEAIRRGLLEQVESSVRWDSIVRHMMEGGAAECVEIGPGKAVAGLLRNIDRNLKAASIGEPAAWDQLHCLNTGGAS